MDPQVKQDDENSCGYGVLTVVALVIIIISAVFTFIFANHMYHGTEDYFDEEKHLKKVEWIPTRTMAVPQRRFIIARISHEPEMCFLIPSELEKENTALRVRRSPREYPLSKPIAACGFTVELEKNGDYCSEMTAESRKRREIGCAPVILKCQNMLGLSDTCVIKEQADIALLCERAKALQDENEKCST
ncbi:unnamed protein product, partial [Mesorhabditis belari]|uniref:Uncharacterized protein n=1 Tax=Mesorhabditis belari TaxID=2138241 RepID=A0AAF3EX65_9BILA